MNLQLQVLASLPGILIDRAFKDENKKGMKCCQSDSSKKTKEFFRECVGKKQQQQVIKRDAKLKKDIPGWNDGEAKKPPLQENRPRKAKKIEVDSIFQIADVPQPKPIADAQPPKQKEVLIPVKPIEHQNLEAKPIPKVEEVKPLPKVEIVKEENPEPIKEVPIIKKYPLPLVKPDVVLIYNEDLAEENVKKIAEGLKNQLAIKIHTLSMKNLRKETLPQNHFLTFKLHLNPSKEDPGILIDQLAKVNKYCKESILVVFERNTKNNLNNYYEQHFPNSGYEKKGEFLKKYIIHQYSTQSKVYQMSSRELQYLLDKMKVIYEEFTESFKN